MCRDKLYWKSFTLSAIVSVFHQQFGSRNKKPCITAKIEQIQFPSTYNYPL